MSCKPEYCKLCPFLENKRIRPKFSPRAAMTILGDCPTKSDTICGKHFTGNGGSLLWDTLAKQGVSREQCNTLNVIDCKPNWDSSASDYKKACTLCWKKKRITEAFKTTPILALGKYALWAINGEDAITKWMGSIYDTFDTIAIPTFNPEAILRNGDSAPLFYAHVERFVDMVKGTLQPFSWGPLHILPNKETLEVLKYLEAHPQPIGLDTEFLSLDLLTADLTSVNLAFEDAAVCVPWHHYVAKTGEVVPSLEEIGPIGLKIKKSITAILADHRTEKYCQNGQVEILSCRHAGCPVTNFSYDTMIAHAIMYAGCGHGLQTITTQYFPAPPWKSEFGKAYDKDPLALRYYGAKDAVATLRIAEVLKREMEEEPWALDIMDTKMRLIDYCVRMTTNGWRINPATRKYCYKQLLAKANRHKKEYTQISSLFGYTDTANDLVYRDLNRRAKQKTKRYKNLCDKSKNLKRRATARKEMRAVKKDLKEHIQDHAVSSPGSSIQVAEILKEHLHERVTVDPITKNPCLDEEHLDKIRAETLNPVTRTFVNTLLNHREAIKLLSTCVVGLKPDKRGLVHPTFNPTAARTLRWAAHNPPIMVWPRNRKGLPNLRRMFVARTKDHWLLECDFAALEFRIAAHLYKVQTLMDMLVSGQDVHKHTARGLFSVPVEEDVEKAHRTLAKLFTYASLYRAAPQSVHKKISLDFPDLTLREVEYMTKRFHIVYKEIFDGQDEVLRTIGNCCYLENPLTRRKQWFYGEQDEKKIVNMIIQETGAHIMDKCFLDFAGKIDWKNTVILTQIHDSMIVETKTPVETAQLLSDCMTPIITLRGLDFPYASDLKVGKLWGENVSCDSVADVARVVAAWNL